MFWSKCKFKSNSKNSLPLSLPKPPQPPHHPRIPTDTSPSFTLSPKATRCCRFRTELVISRTFAKATCALPGSAGNLPGRTPPTQPESVGIFSGQSFKNYWKNYYITIDLLLVVSPNYYRFAACCLTKEFQVPKKWRYWTLFSAILGGCFPWHKPYIQFV